MNEYGNVFLKDNTLTPNFSGMKSRNYFVSIKYFDQKSPTPTKRIDYESEISVLPKKEGWVLGLSKKSFWFNGHEPDLINEVIADEL